MTKPGPKSRTKDEWVASFWARVDKSASNGCWLWIGGGNGNGYGRTPGPDRKMVYAHRVAYELLVGQIPEALELDHLCRNRRCVNPAHLEPVTRRENLRRGLKGVLTTHCPQGHPYDEKNTLVSRMGHRQCRACSAARWDRWHQKKEAAA